MEVIAIVPAYNEEPRIADVLDVLTHIDYFTGIYVVDDGSIDDTSMVANRYDVTTIRHSQNLGKGAAIQTVLDMTDGDYYLFFDADLIGLTKSHVDALIEPLIRSEDIVMSVGTFKAGSKVSVNLAQKYFSILNGQRCLKGCFAKQLPSLSWTRFGVEVFMSKYADIKHYKVCYPVLYNLTHYRKEEKLGFKKGFLYRLQMYKEILYTYMVYKKYI
ncbi:MAG: glycosyltransferase [Thermoanaerobacteraceae bacterium]|nr:glycosyltransferase [Thermoanaerobacteraceae bacterium]